jgi:hypothetical protein
MFNILSGMQEGSRSVVIVERSGPAGLVKGAVVMTTASGNTIALADNGSALWLDRAGEYVFEDLTTQMSGKYTCVYGYMEAETDQYSGTPAIGAFLKPGTAGGSTAGLLITATLPGDAALVCAKVVDSYALPTNPTMTAPVGGIAVTVLRIRTL